MLLSSIDGGGHNWRHIDTLGKIGLYPQILNTLRLLQIFVLYVWCDVDFEYVNRIHNITYIERLEVHAIWIVHHMLH